jgi:XTP/dITP diphosphohydrolase
VRHRVVLVVVSPRLPAGQLTWAAWQALRSGPVLTVEGDSPHVPALREAGVDVLVVDAVDRSAGGVWLTTDPALLADAEVVVGQVDPPGARLLDVVAVMDRLRSPGGCPWDAQQTHASLMPYLLEEAYEAYQALEDGDLEDLREEMGDVLLQVAFHARLAEELPEVERWSIDEVAAGLVDKLVHRHPHVFAGMSAKDAAEVERSWDVLKAAEKGRTSVTDGVPLALPALALAATLQRKGSRLGVPLPSFDGPGGELWQLVARCRDDGVDPEVALRTVARTYRDRLAAAERAARAEGREPAALSPQEWADRLGT